MEESQSHTPRDLAVETAQSLRVLRDQADQTLDSHRQRVSEIELRLNEQLRLVAEELARERLAGDSVRDAAAEQTGLLEQLQNEVAEKEAENEAILEELAAQSLDFETQLAARDEELTQVLKLGEAEQQQRSALQQELNTSRDTLNGLRDQACADCAQRRSELADLEQQLTQCNDQMGRLQTQCQSQQAELDAAREDLQAEREQHEQAAATLLTAQQRIETLSQYEDNSQQLEQTLRKFELALTDVQKLKRENAELHEELLSRPAADDQESPELVSLRAERDALSQRVAELENTQTSTGSAAGQQEMEELQRRFEMAVDDVRQLKQVNAELTEQLATKSATVSGPPPTGPLDWQAQKAQLLAALDAEDEGRCDAPRREQRATIEGTISITDLVVAEKEELLAKQKVELAELQAQLETHVAGEDFEALRAQITAEILSDDQAIQTELARLQQQQQELNDKLREAELEMSVQRATLAREQASLEEKLAQLPADDSAGEVSSTDKPRRRWLSALGIKDEADDDA